MYSKSITTAAALLAAASIVSAAGHVSIQNNCDTTVWWESVGGDEQSGTLPANMADAHNVETYQNLGGVGVSIKMATEDLLTNSLAPITQFEYNYMTGTWGGLWYDISNINGYPFMQEGLTVTPSDSGCQKIGCKPGVQECGAVYNNPSDNSATNLCSLSSDMVINLCGTKNNSSGGSKKRPAEAHAPANVPAPAPAPVPAPAPAPAAVPVVTTLVTVAAAPAPTESWNFFHHPVGWSGSAPSAAVRRHVHHGHHGHA